MPSHGTASPAPGHVSAATRLARFSEQHPDVIIARHGTFWDAEVPPWTIPGEGGVIWKQAYDLDGLLDKLDALFSDTDPDG